MNNMHMNLAMSMPFVEGNIASSIPKYLHLIVSLSVISNITNNLYFTFQKILMTYCWFAGGVCIIDRTIAENYRNISHK